MVACAKHVIEAEAEPETEGAEQLGAEHVAVRVRVTLSWTCQQYTLGLDNFSNRGTNCTIFKYSKDPN